MLSNLHKLRNNYFVPKANVARLTVVDREPEETLRTSCVSQDC